MHFSLSTVVARVAVLSAQMNALENRSTRAPSVRLEAYFERCLKPWDFAAGMLLIEEAGGRVTTFAGSAVDVTRPSDILSSNGRIGILLENELLPL